MMSHFYSSLEDPLAGVGGVEPAITESKSVVLAASPHPPHIESYDQSHMTLIIISHTARLVNSFSLFPSDFCKNLSLDYLRKRFLRSLLFYISII